MPDALTRERRELLHAYTKAVEDRTAATNSSKATSTSSPSAPAAGPSKPRPPKMGAQPARLDPAPTSRLLAGYYRNLRFQSERRKVLQRLIGRQICAEPLMLRCMKLLGIGQINAFALLAIIGDVRRFERPEKLVAYIGLNPASARAAAASTSNSASASAAAATCATSCAGSARGPADRQGHPLGQWGWKIFARRGNRNVAVTAVARKLVVRSGTCSPATRPQPWKLTRARHQAQEAHHHARQKPPGRSRLAIQGRCLR
ncbi:MAG: transposase [Akkermansiaceae bacterium]|nr:transposase [Akkermansiaceae bacterium]